MREKNNVKKNVKKKVNRSICINIGEHKNDEMISKRAVKQKYLNKVK